MTGVITSKYGWYISHEEFIKEIYNKVDDSEAVYQFKPELFEIIVPYKESRSDKLKPDPSLKDDAFETEVYHVKELYEILRGEIPSKCEESRHVSNKRAVEAATEVYTQSGKNLITYVYGGNVHGPTTKTINNTMYLFPENCTFYSKDVSELSQNLGGAKYDLILLDPPWWNKYIRRKRKHTQHGYDMLYNEQLKNLPLENHLCDDGLVVVWCTNSPQHVNALKDAIFPKWGVKYLGKWYWVKVTQSGEPVCPFAKPPRKQPFEQIIFGCKGSRDVANPPSDRLVVSVPSALHSHKPPLIRLLQPFLPDKPACLELFARYLLPGWTSYGKEVLRLQHESLYERMSKK